MPKREKRSNVVAALTKEAQLRRKIRHHLADLGFGRTGEGELCLPEDNKALIRALHRKQRMERIASFQTLVDNFHIRYQKYFADGASVVPANIRLRLELVAPTTIQAEIFRVATLTWSVPVSNGFGRRLRYLVWDDAHGKLAGIAALGDPVFNLSVRDREIGWSTATKSDNLVNLLDAYVLGALPPYNFLLGGKAVACVLRSKEVVQDFSDRYGNASGLISKRNKSPHLLAITTSSSLGRSSVYNRLALNGSVYFREIGYSLGWGHFHIGNELFNEIRKFLRTTDHPYADGNRFGNGPNWRLRTIREGFKALGLNENLLRHGVQRQIFFCELADNALACLRDRSVQPSYTKLETVGDISTNAVHRWMRPRGDRKPEYKGWQSDQILKLIAENVYRPFQTIPDGRQRAEK